VCNITALPPDVRELLTAALAGKPCAPLERVELASALNYGGRAVLRDAWQRFGLDQVVAAVADPRQRALLQAMIFGRVLCPSSKRALAEQAQGTLLAAACGLDPQRETFDEDELYEAMDALNGHWVSIEKALYRAAFPDAVSLVLYDLTSVYFEGKGPAGLGAYGYRRTTGPSGPRCSWPWLPTARRCRSTWRCCAATGPTRPPCARCSAACSAASGCAKRCSSSTAA
jgi:hypothetical protein